MSVLQELSLNVEKGKRKLVPGLVQQALDEGIDPNVILNEGMIDAMGRVGEAFRDGKIFVPEMLIAAKAMQAGVATLKPALAAGGAVSRGKIILGTVAGDLHDIGKNLDLRSSTWAWTWPTRCSWIPMRRTPTPRSSACPPC